MKSRKSFPLRLDPVLYGALEEWAAQELRSVNAQIEYLLKQAVAKRRNLPMEPPSDQGPGTPSAGGPAEW